jgi:hypothetical protein
MAITQKFAARTGDKASDINRRINQKVKLFLSVVAKFFFKLFDDKFLSLFFLFSPCSVFVFAAQVKVFSDRGKITRALPPSATAKNSFSQLAARGNIFNCLAEVRDRNGRLGKTTP